MRGGTNSFFNTSGGILYFNPPAPCGAGPTDRAMLYSPQYFNPPAPCRAGHPEAVTPDKLEVFISIHPPRTGRDKKALRRRGKKNAWISIHPPRAGRDLVWDKRCERGDAFQSTRPVRGGIHQTPAQEIIVLYFNPPAPCGRDVSIFRKTILSSNFNPPAPCGAGQQRPRTAWISS